MSITDKSIKILWSNAAGRCSFSGCGERLTVEQASNFAPYTLGEMAHIRARSKGGNRYDSGQTDEQRDGYENLILLCPNHHTLIDKPENESLYSVEILLEMKVAHETAVSERLDSKRVLSLDELKDEISVLLSENRQAWAQYGPMSSNAKMHPHSDEVYALWLSERLTTIVPNNRAISRLLQGYRTLFHRSKQPVISIFLRHAEQYERWVNDEIPYHVIQRFPVEFEEIINEG